MRKIIVLASLAILLLVPFSACSANLYELNLDYALAHANQRRDDVIRPSEEYVTALFDARPARETSDLRDLMTEIPPTFIIDTEYAIYDTMSLFELLRNVYGAYFYFGGDEIFLPMRDNIIAELNTRDSWTHSNLGDLFFNNLSTVIADNHFTIAGRRVGAFASFFALGEPFARSDNGFRHIESGLYVAEVVGHDLDEVFRLAIDETGAFYYTMVIAIPRLAWRYEVTIIFENGNEVTKSAQLTPSRWVWHEPPSLRWEGDIPVVVLRSMGNPYGNNTDDIYNSADANTFISFAYELADEPVIIVDIRSNMGGSPLVAPQWLYRILGEVIPSHFRVVDVGDAIVTDDWLEIWSIPEETYRYFSFPNSEPIENDQLIILLTDRHAGSAGDKFTNKMLCIENTLIVGQNTAGVLITNSFGQSMYLPNSGIPFAFGPGLFLYPDHFAEGFGIAPDIWVTGCALTATLAMLQSY